MPFMLPVRSSPRPTIGMRVVRVAEGAEVEGVLVGDRPERREVGHRDAAAIVALVP